MQSEASTYVAITQLHAAYADVVARMAWSELGDLMVADARFTFDLGEGPAIELVGPEAVGQFGSRATDSFTFYSYQPLNTVLTQVGLGEATGRFYALEVALIRGSDAWLEIYGAYDDEYVERDGSWRFARRDFRTLARRLDGRTAVPGTAG